jgi:hypothetical protein
VIGVWKVVHAPGYVDCDDVTTNGTFCQHCDTGVLNYSLAVIIIDWLLFCIPVLYAVEVVIVKVRRSSTYAGN